MSRPIRTLLLAAAIALALPATAPRAEPFTFQGHLAQSGTPLDGSADLAFKLYSAETGGAQLGSTISATGYPVVDGVFTVDLDFGAVVFDGSARWLQVEVNGTPLSGRIEILPAPVAASSNALRGRNVAATAPLDGQVLSWSGGAWIPTTPSTGGTYSAGNGLSLSGTVFSVNFAGSGAENTASRSDHDHYGDSWSGNSEFTAVQVTNHASGSGNVIAAFNTSADSESKGLYGESQAGFGVVGYGRVGTRGSSTVAGGIGAAGTSFANSGAGVGVEARAGSPDGFALKAVSSATTGNAIAVYGETGSADGVAVRGNAPPGDGTSGNSIGVRGTGSTGVKGEGSLWGVHGVATGEFGEGVYGESHHPTGFVKGVLGRVISPFGSGIYGENNATSGFAPGVTGTTDSPTGYGVFGHSMHALGRAVVGVNEATNGDAAGVYGQTASGAGYGVVGYNAAVTGSGAGVRGVSDASAGVGVQGLATHASGVVSGVRGETTSSLGSGVQGNNTSTNGGSGVYGLSVAALGRGVLGVNQATTGDAAGVYGQTASGAGYGVVGYNPGVTGSGAGVLARTASGEGAGLRAENSATSGAGSGNALVAIGNLPSGDTMSVQANGTGSAWAIRATSAGSQVINAELTSTTTSGSTISAIANTATGRAGYFQNTSGQAAQFVGSVDVSGTLSKGGGSFKIDHPLDPANQFLLHSFVESPDMMNVYNGNVITDARGYATIDLPDWFEALNRDFRYQLTVIGSFARAMVAEEVQGNRFAIRTETPNTKVSWQVTGIRKDRWAEKNRIPVEVQKAPAERGKYLHPELYGAPAGKRIGFEPAKDASRLAPTKSAAAPGKLP
jgi:hypothetical protein